MTSQAAKVVALLGVAGSGKSLVTRRLLENSFSRLRFGDPQREMLAAGFGLGPLEIDGEAKTWPQSRFGGHSVVQLVRSLSYDWGRARIHSDVWVGEWRRRLALLSGLVVSDDLQWPNEAAAVREAGGIIIRVVRPGLQIPSGLKAVLHRQERIQCDLELVNDGPSLLHARTDEFINGITERTCPTV